MMKSPRKYSVRLWITCLGLAVLAGCATVAKVPIYTNPKFKTQAVDEITLLPVVDGRVDKSIQLDLEKYVRQYVKSILVRDKHYRVRLVSVLRMGAKSITEADLRAADPGWIRTVGPADARWPMVVVLDEFSRKLTFGSTANAELSGALFDKKKGIVLWRDNGVGQTGTAGLLGMLFLSSNGNTALVLSAQNLMASFPERPGKE